MVNEIKPFQIPPYPPFLKGGDNEYILSKGGKGMSIFEGIY
jgi:hypothetical protein